MADADDIVDEIAENALRPKESAAGSHKTVEHSLADQVKAAQFLRDQEAATTAATRPGFGLRFQQIERVYR